MIVKSIKITNFRTIKNLYIDFNDITGLWKITGKTGAGKTTVGEAIIFGLFGDVKNKKKDELIRWGQQSASVVIDINSKHRQLSIERTIGKGAKISVLVDGIPMEYTNKSDIQRQLENDYYDVTRNTLETLCLISFNNFKSLTNLNPAETRMFLDQTIGLKLLSDYSNAAKELKKNVIFELTKEQEHINVITAKINEIANTKKQLVTENLDEHISKTTDAITNINNRAKNKLDELSNERDILNSNIDTAQQEYYKATTNEATIRNEGVHIKNKLAMIGNGCCPTCGQTVPTKYIEGLNAEKVELAKKWSKANEELLLAKKHLEDLQQSLCNNANEKTKVINASNSKLSSLNMELTKYKKELELHKFLESNDKNFQEELNAAELNLNMIKSKISDWDSLIDIINVDIRAKIISQYIPYINKEIANICVKLNQPYMITLTPDFNAEIQMADIRVPVSSLSTGQGKTLDMIIILAVVKSLIGNIDFNIFFLDELFSNMDIELRNNMCEVLKPFAANRTIFVLSHADVQNRYFNGTIDAEVNSNEEYNFTDYYISKFN